MAALNNEAVPKSRGKVWKKEATETLTELWCDENVQIAFDQCKVSKDSSHVYHGVLVSYSYTLNPMQTACF